MVLEASLRAVGMVLEASLRAVGMVLEASLRTVGMVLETSLRAVGMVLEASLHPSVLVARKKIGTRNYITLHCDLPVLVSCHAHLISYGVLSVFIIDQFHSYPVAAAAATADR
jgi:hypothetical protein